MRRLAINFLYDGSITKKAASEEAEIPVAFGMALPGAKNGRRLSMLSPIVVPYWIVQISGTKSVILRTDAYGAKEFVFSENTNSADIRRIIGAEIHEASDIPKHKEQLIATIKAVSEAKSALKAIQHPDAIRQIGLLALEVDPNSHPNMLNMTLDSHDALARSEEFQKLREHCRLRVEALEEIQENVGEVLQGHVKAIQNVVKAEKERWKQRVSMMQDRLENSTREHTRRRDDDIYGSKQKHKIALRALTADFSRSISSLESFFSSIVELIQEARTSIAAREENVEGALQVYNDLKEQVTDQHRKLDAKVSETDMQSEKVRSQLDTLEKQLDTAIREATESADAQIAEERQRLAALEAEAAKTISELDESVNVSAQATNEIEAAIRDRLTEVQSEFLELMSWAIDSSEVKNLAPLTQLEIHCYLAFYTDNSFRVFPPCFLPEEISAGSIEHKPVHPSLVEYVESPIQRAYAEVAGYSAMLRKSGDRANLLVSQDAKNKLNEGLDFLQRKNILNTEGRRNIESKWREYSGRCPNCGNEVDAETRFCPKCGHDLHPVD
ncbi:MAG: zinc-ribbon domain-containing protein [Candidatus Thorarchaeota archaeon]|nr:zinc-ribbon domain-containing protein [Candidatus Thorarchaeota archaeon]